MRWSLGSAGWTSSTTTLPARVRRKTGLSPTCRSMASRHRTKTDIFCMVARSEEHTSELQSLMRISYAGFCLKKKKKKNQIKNKSEIWTKYSKGLHKNNN